MPLSVISTTTSKVLGIIYISPYSWPVYSTFTSLLLLVFCFFQFLEGLLESLSIDWKAINYSLSTVISSCINFPSTYKQITFREAKAAKADYCWKGGRGRERECVSVGKGGGGDGWIGRQAGGRALLIT